MPHAAVRDTREALERAIGCVIAAAYSTCGTSPAVGNSSALPRAWSFEAAGAAHAANVAGLVAAAGGDHEVQENLRLMVEGRRSTTLQVRCSSCRPSELDRH